MTRNLFLAPLLAASLAFPMTAHAFTAENRVDVNPRGGSTFEVEEDRRFGAPGQWCAAADYAVRALGADWTSRIYVRGQGNGSRDVVFGLTPAGAKPKQISDVAASVRRPGSNFSVQRAFSYCIQQRLPDNIYN